jgi:hypothetical protein
MKKNCFIVILLFFLISPLCAMDDISLYINGLESIIQEKSPQAKASFNELIEQHPNSEFRFKANDFLYDLNNEVEKGGTVPFYLANLATLSYTSFKILDIFDVEQDSLTIGLSGLMGVGLGITSSYLLSKDHPISPELYSRIITNQTVSMGNLLYLQGILHNFDLFSDYDAEKKILLSSQLLTLNSSMFLSYFGLRDKELQKGKGFFSLQSYAWANYYYWLGTFLFDVENSTTNLIIGMTITDLAYFSSLPIWNKLEWSSTRSGLVSVGGIGGALIGLFTNLIIEEFVPLNQKTIVSVIMGTSLAGKILATYFTRNLDSNKNKQIANNNLITPYPIITAKNEFGVGFLCSF